MRATYEAQLKLLLRTLPEVFLDSTFCLKGGTAINLFLQDFPRLSVDIDLTYRSSSEDRMTSFNTIHSSLRNISKKLTRAGFKVQANKALDGVSEAKLIAQDQNGKIKIEPNFLLRGTIFEPEFKRICPKIRDQYEFDYKILCSSSEDIYGGKMVASLDRQHPRDLFDMFVFFENNKLTEKTMDAFVYYLLSSNRPVHELLDPNFMDIKASFKSTFDGMQNRNVTIGDLESTREELVKKIRKKMNDNLKKLIITVLELQPQFELYKASDLSVFPSIRWKIHNLEKMDKKKREKDIEKTKKILEA